MQKMTIYPTEIKKPSQHDIDTIFNYFRLIDEIESKEEVNIPSEFYSGELMDFLYDDSSKSEELIQYVVELIGKTKATDASYKDIFSSLDIPKSDELKAITGICENKYIKNDELFIDNIEKIRVARNFYLSLETDFGSFKEMTKDMFEGLFFLNNCFKNASNMVSQKEIRREVIRHLDILNVYGHLTYTEENRDSNLTMKKLKSEFNLNCSGIGSNQDSSKFKLKGSHKGKDVYARCNNHTKLFDGNNDFRIYFSWENIEIEEGKIIIGSIGGHIKA